MINGRPYRRRIFCLYTKWPDCLSNITIERFGRLIVAYPWLLILTTIVSVVALGGGATFLGFNADTRVFFSPDDPHLLALEEYENTYEKDDYVIFVLAPKSGDVFSRTSLSAVERLTEAAWKIPYAGRIHSLTNHLHIHVEGDGLLLLPLVENASSLDDTAIDRVRVIANDSPELLDRLLSKDGKTTAVIVALPNRPHENIASALQVAAYARQLAHNFKKSHPYIDLYLTGSVMFDAVVHEVPQLDLKLLLPLMIFVFLAIVALGLRTIWGAIGTLLVMLMSVLAALGVAGWAGIDLNAGNVSAVIIIFPLALAHCVHFISTKQLARQDGASREQSIQDSLHVNMTPMFITSLTTAISFLSLNFAEVPPFRTLGTLSAIGIICAFFLAVTFLPAFLAVTADRVRPGQALSRLAMESFSSFLFSHRSKILMLVGAGTILLVLGIGRITLDDRLVTYFDERFPVRIAADFTEDTLTGLDVIAYSFPAGETGAITNPGISGCS